MSVNEVVGLCCRVEYTGLAAQHKAVNLGQVRYHGSPSTRNNFIKISERRLKFLLKRTLKKVQQLVRRVSRIFHHQNM